MSPLKSATNFYVNSGKFFIKNINLILMSLLVIVIISIFIILKRVEKDKTIVYMDKSFTYSKRPFNMHTAINEARDKFSFNTPSFSLPNIAFDDLDWFNTSRLESNTRVSNKEFPDEIEVEIKSNVGHVGKKRYLPN